MRHLDHPSWCARDHRCNLGEHRAEPVTLANGRDLIVLTRLRAADGRQHTEIRMRIGLAIGDKASRARLARILTLLDALLRHLNRPPR